MPFSEPWPRSGMMLSGTAYQLPTLAHTIDATASGLLPTPRAIDGRSAGQGTKDETLVRRAKSPFGLNLAETVQVQVRGLWPTPNANDNRDRGNLSSPCVQRRARIGKQLMLSQVVSDKSGALNPTWVEWLMGFPSGWTDLNPSETP
jgi:hypothetical protein